MEGKSVVTVLGSFIFIVVRWKCVVDLFYDFCEVRVGVMRRG